MENREHKAIPELSADTKLLVDAMLKCDWIGYAEMRRIIGRDPQTNGNGIVQSAKRILLREHGQVWEAERNQGYKRLNASEIVRSTPEQYRKAMHRKSRDMIRKLTSIGEEYGQLSQEDQARHNAGLVMGSVGAMLSQSSSAKKIEQRVVEAKHALPTAEALRMLAGENGNTKE